MLNFGRLLLRGEPIARGLRSSRLVSGSSSASAEAKPVTFEIYRYQPSDEAPSKPYVEYFTIDKSQCGPMVLDALLKIKNEVDTTLTFRRSCREGICGSCAMNISGCNTLACLKSIEEAEAEGPSQQITVYPLPHLPVVKDLVPDMSLFFEHHASIKPWLQRKTQDDPNKEIRQSIADRDRLDGLYECILCACCTTSCPSYWWNSHEGYLGPAALMQAYRWIADSRDEYIVERLSDLRAGNSHTDLRMEACHQIMNCTKTCPKHLAPGRAIGVMRSMEITNPQAGYPPLESDHGEHPSIKKTLLDLLY